ncbi:TetR/AcrR family transcriptional regulator [Mucilaginibacter phyllosphaerae]
MEKRAYAGLLRDKSRSTKKLLDAVGEIVRKEGYTGLNATNIAKHAGLSRRLITFHFESVDNLIETYVRSKDYWTTPAANANLVCPVSEPADSRKILESLLVNQLDYFSREEEWQKIIIWQISQRSQVMFEIAEEREKVGDEFFKIADEFFDKTNVDIRAISGLLVAGIYYMVLHAKSNDSLFCGIDVNSVEGMNRIKKSIAEILFDAYKRAEKQKSKSSKK